ncbi:MAG TPA: hypothetical protein VF373_11075, partial [Prolixibacteraceae bacterium]
MIEQVSGDNISDTCLTNFDKPESVLYHINCLQKSLTMIKLYFSFFLLIISVCSTLGQKANKPSNVSNKIFISIKPETPQSAVKETTKPPYLEISNAVFSDGLEGNRKIDAEETTEIRFELKNSGTGEGKGLILST